MALKSAGFKGPMSLEVNPAVIPETQHSFYKHCADTARALVRKFFDVTKNKELVYEKEISYNTLEGKKNKIVKVWTKAIQASLDEHKSVYIPNVGEDIYFDESIIIKSNYKLKVDKNQRLVMAPFTGVTFLKNENIISGVDKSITLDNPDCNIVIEGGIWDAFEGERNLDNGNWNLYVDKKRSILGAYGMMVFSNVRDIIIKDCTMTNSKDYAVEISNVEGMYISDIHFINYYKDGIHINGTARYGIVRNLSGVDMGDDMVAFNAWDWNTSAMCFGPIEKVIVENLEGNNNEFRLSPGRKRYSETEYLDCDIRDCVIRNVSGVYTFKIYAQPNCSNTADRSEIVGNIENVYFDNIHFPAIKNTGLADYLPVSGLFEICTDTDNMHFDNIKIDQTTDRFKDIGISVFKVGPLSGTYDNESDNPDDWTELFSPDDICTVKNTYIGKVSFIDKNVGEADGELLIKATRQTINENYPMTTPRGGTGYGIIQNVIFE